jgi:hypothetical protein
MCVETKRLVANPQTTYAVHGREGALVDQRMEQGRTPLNFAASSHCVHGGAITRSFENEMSGLCQE